jgi:hypothetical protein
MKGMQPMVENNLITISSGPRYPRVKMQMTGSYGGFFPTVAAVQDAMRRAGIPLQELSNFCADASASDDDNLLKTCMRWVDVDLG